MFVCYSIIEQGFGINVRCVLCEVFYENFMLYKNGRCSSERMIKYEQFVKLCYKKVWKEQD